MDFGDMAELLLIFPERGLNPSTLFFLTGFPQEIILCSRDSLNCGISQS